MACKAVLVAVLLTITIFVAGQEFELDEGCGKYLGTSSDGRIYFMENTTMRNWADAGNLCRDCGLRLAEVSTRAQNTFLKTVLKEFSHIQYWTSARESRNNVKYFAWDATSSLASDIFDAFADATGGPSSTPYTVCGMYEMKSKQFGWFVAKPCYFRLATLCMP